MAQTFNTILSFVKSTSRKDRRKGVGSLSVSAVAGGGGGDVADSATQAWVRNNFVDKTTEQEIPALKIFSQGIKIGDVSLFKHPGGYVYLDETLVLKGGVVMYGNSSGVDVPSIFDSLPIDGTTIKRDGNGALYVDETALSISGGGGVADSVYWNNVIGKPSWIGSTKPTYKYSEIEERPDLSVYAKTTDIPSLAGYATQSWVENKGYLLATTASSIYQPKITSSNKLAYSLISGTPDLSVYALNTDLAKKWTQNDAKIANWDSAYGWGNHANVGYAKASDVTNEFKNYVKLAGNSQSITAQHDFANGLKIDGISLRKVDNHLYIDSSLVLSGGVTMYGDDGTTVKPIWESIPLDSSTLAWLDGKLSVIGGVGSGGGISEEFLNVTLQGYQPKITSSNKLAYSLISGTPDLSVYFLSSNFTKDNIKSTLGISDWALASTKPTYTASEVGALSVSKKENYGSLNDYTTAGIYRFNRISDGSEGMVPYGNLLVVRGGTFDTLAQLYFNDSDGKAFIRSSNIPGLSSANWNTIAFTSDIPTKLSQLTDDVVAGRYLPLSGGVLNGQLTVRDSSNSIVVHRTQSLAPLIKFSNVDGQLGQIGINNIDGKPLFIDPYSNFHTLAFTTDIPTKLSQLTDDVVAGKYLSLSGGTVNGSITANSFVGNLTGNAVSATKLATARTIWGQSFDGTVSISGNIYSAGAIRGTSAKAVYLHQSGVPKSLSDLALAVGVGYAPSNYGAFVWGESSGNAHIQVGRNDGGADAYNLFIQEYGGNVSIGGTTADAKLHVHGTAKFTGDTTFSSKVIVGTIPVYQSADGTLFVDANVVFRGGVAMYGNTTTTINEE